VLVEYSTNQAPIIALLPPTPVGVVYVIFVPAVMVVVSDDPSIVKAYNVSPDPPIFVPDVTPFVPVPGVAWRCPEADPSIPVVELSSMIAAQ
jgi:hypothetical protein